MQSIDQHRQESGLVLVAATNALDGLDPALTREGRFDLQIRVDLPDERTRMRIFRYPAIGEALETLRSR